MTSPEDEERIKVPRFEESAGFYTTAERSRNMAKIGARDTKPELAFRKALHGRGHRFRVNSKALPGKPDVSNVKKKYAVFIDGEFWHGYNWEKRRNDIKSNREFWIPKIERNMQRDREVNAALKKMGFRVFRFWQNQLKRDMDACIAEVQSYLKESRP